MKSLKLLPLLVMGVAHDQANMDYQTPHPRHDTSKPASMSNKEWKKRKRKIKAAKIARRNNRSR